MNFGPNKNPKRILKPLEYSIKGKIRKSNSRRILGHGEEEEECLFGLHFETVSFARYLGRKKWC